MSNNNHNYSSCAFAEEMLAYFYGESGADETKKCEAHLKICPSCADELAGFGAARTAVLEWRAEDFSTLTTPAFQIPGVQTVAVIEKTTWVEQFKNLFAFNPAWATAALTVLIVSVGAFVLLLNFAGNREVVEINGKNDSMTAGVSPTVEPPVKTAEKNPATDKNVVFAEKPSIVKNDSLPETRRETEMVPTKAVVKIPSNAAKNNPDNPARVVKESKNDVKKSSPAKKRAVPNLDEDEDEDDSLRLADLFAELDTK